MNLKAKLDQAHKKSDDFEPSHSLLSFLEKDQFGIFNNKELSILELGCGQGSVLEQFSMLGESWSVTGLDISCEAISIAQARLRGRKQFSFIEASFDNILNDKNYDVIIDSHLLHCITCDEQREHYWKTIEGSLRAGGLFVLESMVAHENMSFDYDQFMDYESSTLFQDNLAIRKIKAAKDLELELKNSGLKIFYLEFFESLQFIAHPERKKIMEGDPEVMRALLFKAKTM